MITKTHFTATFQVLGFALMTWIVLYDLASITEKPILALGVGVPTGLIALDLARDGEYPAGMRQSLYGVVVGVLYASVGAVLAYL